MVKQVKDLIYAADFECTTDADDCRVWGWGLARVSETANPDRVVTDHDLDLFFDCVTTQDCVVYFHNLAYDGEFILCYLLANGFMVSDSGQPGTITSMISGQRKWYSVTLTWWNGVKVTLKDSFKILPFSVERIARAFGYPFKKLVIDYDEYREGPLTSTDREYLAHDVAIMARALHEILSKTRGKLTVGAEALAEYKSLNNRFDKYFPVLPVEVDEELRRAYRGGWVYVNPKYAKQVVGPGNTYDVNSLYPYVMSCKPIPIGEPDFTDDLTDGLFIASITVTAKLRKGYLPCIQLKGHVIFGDNEYVSEIREPTTLYVTNVDLALYEEHYELDILCVNGCWSFRQATGLFSRYIEKFRVLKENSTGANRELAKLMLNSLYGKFGTNPDVTGRVPELVDGALTLPLGSAETRDPVYIPVAVFITAYARDYTIREAQRNYDVFVYADTDSVHILGELPEDIQHPSRFGAWKHELAWPYAVYWRAKTYTDMDYLGVYHTHIAGMPKDLQDNIRFSDYFGTRRFEGKLRPKHVRGGVVLAPVAFSIQA